MADRGEGSGGGGGGGGGGWGLFLKQTEAWRAEKKFLRPPPPSLSQGLDDPAPSIT